MAELDGKRALVTGGAQGLGKAIATLFVARGAKVVIADIDEAGAKLTADELGESVRAIRCDVTSASDLEAAVQATVDTFGGLDIMVNNAGVGIAATTPETAEEDWDLVLDVCLKGTFLGMKYAIPAIRDSGGGSVINMSSIAALVGLNDRAAYSAAKGGILSLTRAAAIDHIEEGVRVNCIAPGTVDTPWVARITAGYDDPEEARERMKARQPHGRLVSPEEIAAMAAYLASDEAGSAVGACMVVDGGMTAR
jgi:NAD(P)-dependent dehydrogenase (short-subunit alcohol dehydrogenase family)